MLRGKKAADIATRFRLFIYGEFGTGKTTASIQFPKPYILDMENGGVKKKYTDILKENGAEIFCPVDYDDLIQEIKTLLTVTHPFKTLVIDPVSWMYMDLKNKSEVFLSKNGKDGSEYGKHTARADNFMYRLFQLIFRLDMNVVITAQIKTKYEMVHNGTKEVMQASGNTYDASKKFGNIFDVVLRAETFGKEHRAYIEKSREEGFIQGEYMPFSYQEIEKRYGKEDLFKESSPIILPSTEDLEEFEKLTKLIQVPEKQIEKWLGEGKCENFSEMEISKFKKCIETIKSKIKGEANV